MADAVPMIEVWRGDYLEAIHRGHAVVCDTSGQIVQAWGDPDKVFLPRSAVKMIQALPLVESGAADAAGLGPERLSLACASHIAAHIHTDTVATWLGELGLDDSHLACGPQEPRDREARDDLIRAGKPVCRVHNNCSGKHTGMLTLAKHLVADLDYVNPNNPVQKAIVEAFEDLTGEPITGYGIDGCSAPNYAVGLTGLARAMAFFAGAREGGPTREKAAFRLHRAMATHPEMVSGNRHACTELMRAMGGRVTIKGGAEGSYTAILPDHGLGMAIKVEDGSQRGQESVVAALLVHLGVLDPEAGQARRWYKPVVKNFAGQDVGDIRPAAGFPT